MNMKDQMSMDNEQTGQSTKKGLLSENVWFASKEHRENYIQLMERFHTYKTPEYTSACYVVSHPEIYNRVDWSTSETPIGWCWGEWNGEDDYDEHGYHPESEIVGQLSNAYRGLIRSTIELFTDTHYYFELSSWLRNADDEVYKLFLQSLELRRDRLMIKII